MADIEDLNLTVGFGRPCTESLADSVDEYQGHLFICTGMSEQDWPVKIEQISPLVMALSALLKKNRATIGKIKLSVSELTSAAVGGSAVSALYFTRGGSVVLSGLDSTPRDTQLAALLQYLSQHTPLDSSTGLHALPLAFSHVLFVCAHVKVDTRCAYCGPRLHQLLTEQVAKRQLSNKVLIAKTSHIGGHKYAGNVLCFPDGRWYGYVTPEHVTALIDHVLNDTTFTALLRGQMQLK